MRYLPFFKLSLEGCLFGLVGFGLKVRFVDIGHHPIVSGLFVESEWQFADLLCDCEGILANSTAITTTQFAEGGY